MHEVTRKSGPLAVCYETRSHRIAVQQNPQVAKRRHSLAQHVSAGKAKLGRTESALADDTSLRMHWRGRAALQQSVTKLGHTALRWNKILKSRSDGIH